ncbi:hypothetical protein [Bacteroides heparinolyticus]|uniref:hypothetical protein n=1 Tax=Prevotella heparinolytica TaxID=28113 RepID=UPI0035A1B985
METVAAKIIYGVDEDGFVYVRVNTGQRKLHYIYRDYQGSVTDITDASGTVAHRMRYSPWGKLLHTDGTLYTRSEELSTDYDRLLLLGRGYTGHEDLGGLKPLGEACFSGSDKWQYFHQFSWRMDCLHARWSSCASLSSNICPCFNKHQSQNCHTLKKS